MEGVDLGALPGRLLRLAAEARSLGHRPRLARVLDLAVLGVVDRLAKAPVRRFLVDLGADRLVAAANDVDRRFLAAHELAHHRIDQAFLEQGAQARRRLQRCAAGDPSSSHPGCGHSCTSAMRRITHAASAAENEPGSASRPAWQRISASSASSASVAAVGKVGGRVQRHVFAQLVARLGRLARQRRPAERRMDGEEGIGNERLVVVVHAGAGGRSRDAKHEDRRHRLSPAPVKALGISQAGSTGAVRICRFQRRSR